MIEETKQTLATEPIPVSDENAAASASLGNEVLRVEHLKKYFPIATNFFGKPTAYLRAVDDISLSLERGKTIGIVGESGCGKTTLGRTILKLYDITGGEVYFEGKFGVRIEDLVTKEELTERLSSLEAKFDAVLKENVDLKNKLSAMEDKYENKDFGNLQRKGIIGRDKDANSSFDEYAKQFM